jgi:hypothetical protein
MISKWALDTSHFHIVLEIGMSGALYSVIYAIIQCKGTTLSSQLKGKSCNFCPYL